MSSSSSLPQDSVDPAKLDAAKTEYMETVSRLFEANLLEVFDSDTTGDGVKHLRSCIEAGVAVWGHPLVLDNPFPSST